jgi:hypothetical protein
MRHHRKCLPLGFELRDDAAGVHARLDHLESDLPLNGVLLLRQEDHTTAALPDLLDQPVFANAVSQPLSDDRVRRGPGLEEDHRILQKTAGTSMRPQQELHPFAQTAIGCTGPVQIISST